jgi:hypothetical protein
MVVQHIHLRKLNRALHGKETYKVSTRSLVIDSSKCQVYSGNDIRDSIYAQEERKKAKAAEKKSKAEARAAKKEARARMEEEWMRIKSDHDDAVKSWKLTCERLASEGVPKRNWPKGPVR